MEKGGLVLAGQAAVPGFTVEALKHLAGLPCLCSQTSEPNRKKGFFFAARSESVASFQHGVEFTAVNLLVFQFLAHSSGFLLPQKAQMLVAL